jgi:hypothetical protein
MLRRHRRNIRVIQEELFTMVGAVVEDHHLTRLGRHEEDSVPPQFAARAPSAAVLAPNHAVQTVEAFGALRQARAIPWVT